MRRSALYQRALISTALPRLGVTTRSPTFASIQVSWYPGAPCTSRPSAGSTRIPKRVPRSCRVDDLFKLRKQPLQRAVVTAHLNIALRRMEEPKSCVGGVIEPLTLSLGKHVRDESVLQILREGSQDVSGFLGAARCEGQPLEADHRVASPIREPMIARDDGALFVAGGVRQAASSSRPAGLMMNWSAASTSSEPRLVWSAGCAILTSRSRRLRSSCKRPLRRQGVDRAPILNRRDQRDRNPHVEIGAEDPWTVEIAGSVITA